MRAPSVRRFRDERFELGRDCVDRVSIRRTSPKDSAALASAYRSHVAIALGSQAELETHVESRSVCTC